MACIFCVYKYLYFSVLFCTEKQPGFLKNLLDVFQEYFFGYLIIIPIIAVIPTITG